LGVLKAWRGHIRATFSRLCKVSRRRLRPRRERYKIEYYWADVVCGDAGQTADQIEADFVSVTDKTVPEGLFDMAMSSSDESYVLGATEREHERLIRQSRIFNPFTERLFRNAGISRG
jgi:hypothetical protein